MFAIDKMLKKAWKSERKKSKSWWSANVDAFGLEGAHGMPFRQWPSDLWEAMVEYWQRPEVEVSNFIKLFYYLIL